MGRISQFDSTEVITHPTFARCLERQLKRSKVRVDRFYHRTQKKKGNSQLGSTEIVLPFLALFGRILKQPDE